MTLLEDRCHKCLPNNSEDSILISPTKAQADNNKFCNMFWTRFISSLTSCLKAFVTDVFKRMLHGSAWGKKGIRRSVVDNRSDRSGCLPSVLLFTEFVNIIAWKSRQNPVWSLCLCQKRS